MRGIVSSVQERCEAFAKRKGVPEDFLPLLPLLGLGVGLVAILAGSVLLRLFGVIPT